MYCVQNCKNNKNNKCHSIENCQHQWSNPIELIADHYGLENQTEKLLEELRELIEAIEQNKPIEELTTELVDVPIMCEQVIYLHEVEEEAKTEREFKISRQLGRIQKELKEDSEHVTVTEEEVNEYYCMWYKCSGCGCKEIMDNFEYCPVCGKKIDWGGM